MRKLVVLLGIVACLACVVVSDDVTKALKYLKVYDIKLGKNISAGVANWRVKGFKPLGIRLYNSPLPGGDLLIGWSDSDLVGHVTYLKKDAQKGYVLSRDVSISGREVRGIAAMKDGSFGVLAWDRTNETKMFVQKWTKITGSSAPTMTFEAALVNSDNHPTGFGIGDSRMELDDNGEFSVYYHVHSLSGHEGDTYFRVNSATGAVTRIWSWGCSHSMSNLLSYNPRINKTLSICVTDCYPGTPGTVFENISVGGLYTEDSYLLWKMAGGCNGCVGGEVGMVAPLYDGGWVLVFNSHKDYVPIGQDACYNYPYFQDVGLAFVGSNKKLAREVEWLTDTDANEYDPALARYGAFCGRETCKNFGQEDQMFMIGWKSALGTFIGWINSTGSIISGPIDVSKVEINGVKTVVSWGARDDTWRTLEDGGVSWLYAPGEPKNLVRVFVMEHGDIPLNPASFVTPCYTILIAILMCFAVILF